MKGEARPWSSLNDKLDTLHATKRLPEAIRVAETALEIARRAFKRGEEPLATSFEKLGELLEEKGDYTAAEANLLKAHTILEKRKPPDQRAIYRSARRLAALYDSLGQSEEAINFYQKAIAAGTQIDDIPYADIGTMLNNIELILRKSGRKKAAELYQSSLKTWEEVQEQPSKDYDIVVSNYADLLRSIGQVRKAHQLEVRARKRRSG